MNYGYTIFITKTGGWKIEPDMLAGEPKNHLHDLYDVENLEVLKLVHQIILDRGITNNIWMLESVIQEIERIGA